jgi:flavin-dependent dehydrogenase
VPRCDVLVVGLGPAGAAVAMRLERRGLDVLVVTRTPRICDGFVETLGPTAVAELARLGIEEADLSAIGSASYGIEAAWGGERPRFHSHILDPPAMRGWHVDRARFNRLLARKADEAGIRVLEDFQFAGAIRTGGGWSVTGRGASPAVQCRILVDATGRAAIVARALGVRRRTLDRACAAYAVTDASTGVLRVTSDRYGWWYSTPLAGARATAGIVSDGDILREIGAVSPGTWSALAARVGIDAAPVDAVIRTCACGTAVLERAAGTAWLAVGDAALCSDPLDGHGIHRALRSGRVAAEAIADALHGSRRALPAFAASQSSEMMQFVDLRRRQYARETRWALEAFWSRRQGTRWISSSTSAVGRLSSR